MFSSPKTSYMEANTQKDKERGDFVLKISPMYIKCAAMHPKCLSCAESMLSCSKDMKFVLVCPRKRPKCAGSGPNMLFFGALSGKSSDFKPNFRWKLSL